MVETDNVTYITEDDETEISLGNLFAIILRRWKIWLGSTIIAAVVIGGALSAYDSVVQRQGRDPELAADALGDSAVEQVRQVYQRYLYYEKAMAAKEAYLDQSVLMNLDPDHTVKETIGYRLDSDHVNVVNSFASQSLGQQEYEQIAKILSSKDAVVDPGYVSEVISFSGEHRMTTDIVQNTESPAQEGGFAGTQVGGVQNSIEGEDEEEDTGILLQTAPASYRDLMSVTFYCSTEEQSTAIAQIIEQAVAEYADKLKSSGVSLTLSRISENYTEGSVTAVADQQQTKLKEQSDLQTEYQNFLSGTVDKLEEDEKAYFDLLAGNTREQDASGIRWKRNFGIGALIGLAAALVILIIAYLASGCFHTAEEAQDALRNRGELLGTFTRHRRQHRGLGKLFQSLADFIDNKSLADAELDENTRSELIADRIRHLVTRAKGSRLFFADNYSSAYGDEIRGKIEGAGKLCAASGNPLSDPEALRTLQKSDAVVILQGINDTKKSSLDQLLEICREAEVPVIGMVAVMEAD